MYKYKILLSYDGTCYGGWQIQPNAVSIQSLLEESLATLFKTKINVVGSGRTDAGVHAIGQVAHFVASTFIPLNKLLYSLNSLLPKDIRIHEVKLVKEDFHAQYSATGKIYSYYICPHKIVSPFKRLYCWHLPYKMNIENMKEAAKYFLGEKDFLAFANHASEGSASRDAVRNIERIEFLEEEGLIRIDFEADGFLYKMVRNITGTLVDVGFNRFKVEDIPEILESKDRRKAGAAAPPQGLFLRKVHYPHRFEISDIG